MVDGQQPRFVENPEGQIHVLTPSHIPGKFTKFEECNLDQVDNAKVVDLGFVREANPERYCGHCHPEKLL